VLCKENQRSFKHIGLFANTQSQTQKNQKRLFIAHARLKNIETEK